MVTFRFYLVSIVAFFLALAVGVVVGSVLDEGISRSLKDRLESVQGNLDSTVAAIDQKNDEITDLSSYAEASAPFAVSDSVVGTTTLVVAEPGLATGPVEDLVLRLRQGGSHVEGIVWLDSRWDLANADDRSRVAQLLGTTETSADKLRAEVWARVLGPGAPGAPGTTDSTAAPTPPPTTAAGTGGAAAGEPVALFASPLLTSLEDAGLVRLVRLDGDNGAGGAALQAVAVTGTESTLAPPGSGAVAVVEAAAGSGLPAVLAEQYVKSSRQGAPARGDLVGAARAGSTARFSTVDDLDLVAGRVAAVLALADLRNGVVGQYGYGPDAEGVLPRWLGP
jgi:hypothetical protein